MNDYQHNFRQSTMSCGIKGESFREITCPTMNDALKSNSHSLVKLIKTAGEFIHKICSTKEQYAHSLLSVVETFRKKSSDIKKERCALSSSMSTWETLLGEYERQAQDTLKMCAKLTQNVNKPLSEEAAKRKAICKKIFAFREAGENRIEKADEASQKYHKDYCDACAKLNKAQNTEQAKEGKSSGEYNSLFEQEHYTILCHNAHNSYVLQLFALNGMQEAFYSTSLPQMLDDLQGALEDATRSMALTFKECSKIEKENHEESIQRLNNLEKIFEMVDSSADTVNFVKNSNNPGPYNPARKVFQKPEDGYVVSVPDNKLSVHTTTEPVLKRKYIALSKKARLLSNAIEKERVSLRSLKGLKDSYTQNPSCGRAEDVDINLIVQKNDIRNKELHKQITDAQLDLFTPDIQRKLHITEIDLKDDEYDDDESLLDVYDKRQSMISSVMAKPKTTRAAKHDFVEHSFKKPVFCFYCNKLLKGFLKQGVKCKTCRMSVHHKCQENVPDCSGELLPSKRKTMLAKTSTSFDSDYNDFDDFDASYSDIDEAATPPSIRKLTQKPSPERGDDFYDVAEECLAEKSYGVALYDYSGENVGDLKLRAGDKILLKSTSDNNWWEGTCKGRSGYFPASYIAEISQDSVILRCLFDFTAQEADELSVVENQIIVQIQDEGNGWIVGRSGSVEGAIPSSYVERI